MQISKNNRLFVLAFLLVISLGISCSDDVIIPEEPILTSYFLYLDVTKDSLIFEYTDNNMLSGISVYTFSNLGTSLTDMITLRRNSTGDISSMNFQSIVNGEFISEEELNFVYENGLISSAGSQNRMIEYTYDAQDRIIGINDARIGDTRITYNDNGNVQEVLYSQMDQSSTFDYDSERNPFSSIDIPSVVLLLLDRSVSFSGSDLHYATVLSPNNVLGSFNIYRPDNLPKRVSIYNYFYSDER